MTSERHFDVAAYALGVLDPDDATRFEEHLVDCAACGVELDSMLPVVEVLADLDADSLVATEQSRREGVVLQRMIGEVGQERRRSQHRRMYSLAAAVVAFAMLSVASLFAGAQWFAPQDQPPTQQQAQTPRPTQSPLDPLPPTSGPGIGGPDLPPGHFGVTDARTGVRADVAFEPKDWGTQISFAIMNIKGPLTCRLVAVRTNGEQEVLTTWTVGEQGWGTAARPEPLLLSAGTALPRKEIAHVQVQALDTAGTAQTLVRVP